MKKRSRVDREYSVFKTLDPGVNAPMSLEKFDSGDSDKSGDSCESGDFGESGDSGESGEYSDYGESGDFSESG